jgi:hypothetical protein
MIDMTIDLLDHIPENLMLMFNHYGSVLDSEQVAEHDVNV